MEKRVSTTLRMPPEVYEEVSRIAREEERPLNTQLLRLIRWGLERYHTEAAERERPGSPES
jgi:hypothetical protein